MNKQPQLATDRTSRPPPYVPAAPDLHGITIRAVGRDDWPRIVQAFRALEPESIRKRFFFVEKNLGDEEVRRLTESDGTRDVVLVATVANDHQETVVGLGRYVRSEARAEVAFTVEEDYQGRGIAGELLRRLTDIARGSGVLWFEADVLLDNEPMLKVFRRSGLPMQAAPTSGIVHLTLCLREAPGARPAVPGGPRSDRTATFP